MAADPNRVIPPAVAGALNCLKAANKEENVKRFVLTSSSITVVQPQPDKEGIVLTSNSWNDEAVKKAWEEGSENPNKPVDVYAASKIESEKAIWEFYNDSNLCRSDLVVNTGEFDVCKPRPRIAQLKLHSSSRYELWKKP